MKRKLAIAGGVLAVTFAVAAGIRAFMVWRANQDVLPEMVDPPPGPRAPTREFLGLEIGASTVADAELAATRAGAKCANTSFRALMEQNREATKQKMAEAEARGDDPDGVTGASLVNHRSKKERNPQVRLACDDVATAAFADRQRAPGEPLYWLMIFDSDKHGLRHTSVSRRIGDVAIASEEWRSAVDNMTRRFGGPTKLREPPASGDVPQGGYFEAEWQFADLKAQVTMFRVGARVRFTERVEVPWPVRVDVVVAK